MKFNTTYDPKIDLKETLILIDGFKASIYKYFKKKYNLIEVFPPSFDDEESNTLMNINEKTRHIAFDFGTEYRVGKLHLSHTNWLRKTISRLNLKNGEGLIAMHSYIWRDIAENSSISASRDEITVQVKVDKSQNIEQLIDDETYNLYDHFYDMAESVKDIVNNKLETIPNMYTAQELNNLMPDLKPIDRESKIISDFNSFILKKPGTKLFSGKIHAYIPPTLYNLNNNTQIFLKDTINSWPMRVASISETINGQEMVDQLKVYRETKFLDLPFFIELSKQKYKIIEFKINLPRLAMALLNKGHISETQAGTNNEETKQIAEKYKIETI